VSYGLGPPSGQLRCAPSAQVCEAHAAWGEEFQKQVAPLPKRTDLRLDPERKLTVGYISPDFFTHSVSYFIEAPITHHRCGGGKPCWQRQIVVFVLLAGGGGASCRVSMPSNWHEQCAVPRDCSGTRQANGDPCAAECMQALSEAEPLCARETARLMG